ncbi:MAG: translation initiation factor IF-2 [Xanthomonadales bacterium]|nr:translation initiation factor IF-2 [Xanthomonadales bacterium]
MSKVTVKQLAEVLGVTVDKLLTQFEEAGLKITNPDAEVSNDDKKTLLTFLRSSHGKDNPDVGAPSKVTLKRKTVSEIKVPTGSRGTVKTVNVEVRKRRTYVKRNAMDTAASPDQDREDAAKALAEARAERDAEEQVVREAEERARQEAEELARKEAEERARLEAEEQARLEAEHQAREEELRRQREEQERAQEEAQKAELERKRQEEEAEREAEAKRKAEVKAAAEEQALLKVQKRVAEEAARKRAAREAEARAKQGGGRAAGGADNRAGGAGAGRGPAGRGGPARPGGANARPGGAPARPGGGAPARPGGNARPGANAGRGDNKPGRPGGGKGGKTRYGRDELHVNDSSGRRRKGKRRGQPAAAAVPQGPHAFQKPTAPVVREIAVPENITVSDLAKAMAIKATELIKHLMKMGVMATINQSLDQDTALLVVEEMGHKGKIATSQDIEDQLMVDEETNDNKETTARPPVVTVMGHVDHGKTSLLDHIRKTRVASGEAGGITQHVGAYHVHTSRGGITFLDTPGHAAFTAMRARGAKVTDIVVLVVAADDGVMPQTREAIQHARAANVPLIVAVNKIDKEEADPDRVKNELSKEEVIPEEWGGSEQFVHVSAKAGTGIDELLDAISIQAEVMELQASAERRARGVVIESSLDTGRGPVATILVQDGTLNRGDYILAGQEFGRVRAMFNESGESIQTAGPSMPAVILGLSSVPGAGDDVMSVENERRAKEVAQQRQARNREGRLAQQHGAKLQNLFEQMTGEEQKSVNLVIKADVQGSVEALRDALSRLTNEEVKVTLVASGVGAITESDATLAQASNAIIIGFNVRADAAARRVIQEADLDLHYYSVIYDAIDEVKRAISGLLGTETKEQILGLAEVKDVFRSSKFGAVAGSLVLEGVVRRSCPIRVLRDNVVIFEGELESLRRYRDDVNEVQSGTECGIAVKQYNDVRPGDNIECFERIEVAKTL